MSRSMARPAMRPSKPGARNALTRCSTLVDHVHGGRAAETRHQRGRERILVLDRARRRRIGEDAGRSVRQRQRQGLAAVVVLVVQHGDFDHPGPAPRADRESPAGRRVVGPGVGRSVGGGVVHGDVAAEEAAQRNGEGENRPGGLLHACIRHRDTHRAPHHRRGAVGQLPPVLPLRADRTRDPALAPRRQRDRHVPVRVGPHRHPEQVAPPVHPLAARDPPARPSCSATGHAVAGRSTRSPARRGTRTRRGRMWRRHPVRGWSASAARTGDVYNGRWKM